MASYGGGGYGKGKGSGVGKGSGGKGGGGGGRSNPGKGEYYKNLSRGGGRGKGGGKGGGDGSGDNGDSDAGGSADGGCRGGGAYEDAMNKRRRHSTADELCRTLLSIDGKPYPAYHDIEKTDYDMGGRFTLCIDHVQSDPFAPPSQCHVRVPLVLAGFPPSTLTPKVREVALRDWLTRRFASAARRAGVDQRTVGEGGWHGRKGGELLVDLPGQHILERSCVVIDRLEGCIEARFTVALPARGRSICGDWAANVLTTTLTELVHEALYYSSSDPAALKAHLDCAEDQQAARAQLAPRGLVAFVADGAMLARRSGASDLPLDSSSAVPFASPPSLRVSLPVPNAKQLVGMGVRRGVTLIVGGGFHGKSTLLEALQLGVYDKVPGDGREGVVTDGAAVKVHACMLSCREGGGRGSYRCARIAADVAIDCCPHQVRAEDGRAVTAVDISPFIDHLPFGKRTTAFATEDASGSTSQAAAIIEALETGASALLMDEDTSATNFLMRDARMQALVAADKEPIKPFITRVSSEHLGLRWIGR